jgi:hypothetical protein
MKTLLCAALLGLALSPAGLAAPGKPAPPLPMRYSGLCDASAAVALDSTHFVVADDEHNVLQVYQRDRSAPVGAIDLAAFLGTRPDRESDLEGAARIGQRIFWIASHGRNKNGKVREERQRLFATEIDSRTQPPTLQPAGQPYTRLLADLIAAPGLRALPLREAAERAPESSGGLNIEGLAATADGRLLIGFRSPLVQGRALVVPLNNPQALLEGQPAAFGAPILLDLGERGVRSIERIGSNYLIVAGPTADDGRFTLFRWSGAAGSAAVALPSIDFGSLRPEALFEWPGSRQVQMLSDDGGVETDGLACKDLPARERGFRSLLIGAPS